MPLPLGGLVSSADTGQSRESSPITPKVSNHYITNVGIEGTPLAYGCSQDDLDLTPRPPFLSNSFDWSPSNDSFIGKKRNRNQLENSPRVLQQTHSRDCKDINRPSKARRYSGPNAKDPFGILNDASLLLSTTQQPFAATDLLSRRPAGGGHPINPFPASGYEAGELEKPSAPPGRLDSRDNTPFRQERSNTGF